MISVIICAHNRKEYLLEAIRSAVHQNLSPDQYEIIVVKNFWDKETDDYIKANRISSIYTEEASFSGKIIEALNVSKGEIISFLDDDDMFFENKLSKIRDEFLNDDCTYVHNNMQGINDKGNAIFFKDNRISFNMSSISIKKEIIKIDILRKARFNLDTIMYAFALEFGGKIKDLPDTLTYYRIHESITHAYTDLAAYKRFYITSLERSLNGYTDVYHLFNTQTVKNLLLHEMIFIKIRLKLFSGQKVTIHEYIQFLLLGHQFNNKGFEYKILIGSILFREYTVKKLYKNEFKKINTVID